MQPRKLVHGWLIPKGVELLFRGSGVVVHKHTVSTYRLALKVVY